jgi:hypothetical protein
MPKTAKPKTHKFEKVIVSEGRYRIRNPKTGKNEYEEITAEDIAEMAETFGTITAKGLKVPAPWKHDFNINTFTKIEKGENGLLEDSTKNAGFWESVRIGVDNETGKQQLIGVVEVPGDPKDPNTPAGKVGTSVRDTSIYLRRKYQMTDDSGETLNNVPMHIALVTHPIEPGQKNFELLDADNEYAIAMSELVMDTELDDVSDLLSEFGIFLPAGTTVENVVPNLRIALNQLLLSKKLSEKKEGPSSPENNVFNLDPIVMSLTNDSVKAILDSKLTNPATGKPFSPEDFKSDKGADPVVAELQMSHQALISSTQEERRKAYRSRINSLIETNRTQKEFAETHLIPQAENYQVKIVNGKIEASPLDSILMSLEAMPVIRKTSTASSTTSHDAGQFGESFEDYDSKDSGDLSEEEMKKIAMSMMAF